MLVMSVYTYSDLHCPNGITSEVLLFCECDFEGTKGLTATVRPVLLTLFLVAFCQVGYHDDRERSFLPHQPPEVDKCVFLRTCKYSRQYFLVVNFGIYNYCI